MNWHFGAEASRTHTHTHANTLIECEQLYSCHQMRCGDPTIMCPFAHHAIFPIYLIDFFFLSRIFSAFGWAGIAFSVSFQAIRIGRQNVDQYGNEANTLHTQRLIDWCIETNVIVKRQRIRTSK